MNDIIIIGVAGGSGSGKTTFSVEISEGLKNYSQTKSFYVLSMDRFYKQLTEQEVRDIAKYNFDHPDAIDFDLVYKVLEQFKSKKSQIELPVQDFNLCKYTSQETVCNVDMLILEGIFAMQTSKLLKFQDVSIYIHTDRDLCLARRILRDCTERKRDVQFVINQQKNFVKPCFDEFVSRQINQADIIVPRGRDNKTSSWFVLNSLINLLNNQEIVNLSKDRNETDYEKIVYDISKLK